MIWLVIYTGLIIFSFIYVGRKFAKNNYQSYITPASLGVVCFSMIVSLLGVAGLLWSVGPMWATVGFLIYQIVIATPWLISDFYKYGGPKTDWKGFIIGSIVNIVFLSGMYLYLFNN